MGRAVAALLLSSLPAWGAGTPAAAPLEIPAGSYRIDSAASRVGFTVGATLHTVRGRGGRVEGDVTVAAGSDTGEALGGEVRIEAASLETGNVRRDRKMRAETLDVARFPVIVFRPEHLGTDTRTPEVAGGRALDLAGGLTLRGVTRPITLRVTASASGERLVADGWIELAWADWGVPDPSVLLLRVEPRVRVTLHVELLPSSR